MTPDQPQADPPDTMELRGYLFEVAGHTSDAQGHSIPLPGKCLGKASKIPKQNKPTGQTAAVDPTLFVSHAPATQSSRPHTPAAPRRCKASRSRLPRGDWRRFRQKPPPLKIVNEPWTAGQWVGLIVVLVLIVAALWLWNAGSEAEKWQKIEGAAKAGQRR